MNETQIYYRYTMIMGAYTAGAFILNTLLYLLFSSIFEPGMQLINYFIATIFIFIGVTNYREQHLNGIISFGIALKTSVLILFWSSIAFAVFMYIAARFIQPNLTSQYLQMLEESLIKAGTPADQVDSLMDVYTMVLTPFTIAFAELFNKTFLGLIMGLAIAFFVKRKPAENSTI